MYDKIIFLGCKSKERYSPHAGSMACVYNSPTPRMRTLTTNENAP